MSWKTLLDSDNMRIFIDSKEHTVNIECVEDGVNSNYVTVRFKNKTDIDRIIEALEASKAYLGAGN